MADGLRTAYDQVNTGGRFGFYKIDVRTGAASFVPTEGGLDVEFVYSPTAMPLPGTAVAGLVLLGGRVASRRRWRKVGSR